MFVGVFSFIDVFESHDGGLSRSIDRNMRHLAMLLHHRLDLSFDLLSFVANFLVILYE